MFFGNPLIIHVFLMATFATLFYKAAEMENKSPWLWVPLSLAMYFVTAWLLGLGWLGCIVWQVLLWAVIAVLRAIWAAKTKY